MAQLVGFINIKGQSTIDLSLIFYRYLDIDIKN